MLLEKGEKAVVDDAKFNKKFPNGITLSWNVNAFVEDKPSLLTRLRDKFPHEKNDDLLSFSSSEPILTSYLNTNKQEIYKTNFEDDLRVKYLLKDVNGLVKPGQLCAVMGASGAGKTTLLNILNFRNRGNLRVYGDIKINNKPVKWKEITSYSGYVQQLDLFIGTLTVKEHLTFMAMLKMDSDVSEKEKHDRVKEVMSELNLTKCENTRIGNRDQDKGISGGEKRRLAFATEILTNPPLLFCDEPTSGLDSFMAQTVVSSLIDLAKQNKTVICTIHQPSSQIFEKFDTLCLLSQGRVAYLGPREDAYYFFKNLGYECPSDYNPADFYIETLAIKPLNREECLLKSKAICDSYQTSDFKKRIDESVNSIVQDYDQPEQVTRHKNPIKGTYNSTYSSQIKWLLWREFMNNMRNIESTYLLGLQSIFVAVFIGLIYLQLKLNEIGVQDYNGVLFILIIQCNFGFIFSVINSLPLELPILYRDVKNRVNSSVTYFISKQLSELPKYILFPFVLVTIVIMMSGITYNAGIYFALTGVYLLLTQVALGFGVFLSVAAPNIDLALGLSIPILIPLLIFGGYFLNNATTPVYFIWAKYISWFYYANESLSIILWGNIKQISCTQERNSNTSICPTERCFDKGGDEVLQFSDIDKNNLGRNIGILVAMAIVFRLMALLILKAKSSMK